MLVGYMHVDYVPVSGRWQFRWMSTDELLMIDGVIQKSVESTVGNQLPPSSKASQLVERVLQDVVRSSPELQSRDWKSYVLADTMWNAFSFQNGTIFVTYNLVHELSNTSELACILGHEMAHVVAQHSYERFTLLNVLQAAKNIVFWTAALAFPESSMYSAMVFQDVIMPALIEPYAAVLPFSRWQEFEADHMGAIFAARAGYDPKALMAMFERRFKAEPEAESAREWTQTHPVWPSRKSALQKRMPQLQAIKSHAEAQSQLARNAFESHATLERQYFCELAQLQRQSMLARSPWWLRWWQGGRGF